MKHPKQTGAVAILVAMLLPLLIAMISMAIDMGQVLLKRNTMQVAADAAAMLAANARQHGEPMDTAMAMARQATQANGFEDGVTGVVVVVAIPPGGTQSFAADNQYVRVTIAQPVNAYLAWIFGVFQTDTSATATAGPAGNGNPCLVSLAGSGSAAFTVGGNGIVTANACGIYINSNSSTAMQLNGNVSVVANTIQVVGGYTQTGSVTVSTVTTGADIKADPFTAFPMPPFSACDHNPYVAPANGNVRLSPGTYCGGISISGNRTVSFEAGLYVLYGGGMGFTGNSTPIVGAGVTFYNTGNGGSYPYASMDINGNVTLNLSAPLLGSYAGMLFVQDPLNTQPSSIVGNAGAKLAGNLYFPTSTLTLNGNSGTDIPIGSVVANRVKVMGNTKFSLSNAYGSTSGAGSQRIGLYE